MTNWKESTPEILRLSAVEKWAEARYKRLLANGDIAAAQRAANFYIAIAARGDAIAMRGVTTY